MIVFSAVQCERAPGNHQVEGLPYGRVGVSSENRQMVIQLSQ